MAAAVNAVTNTVSRRTTLLLLAVCAALVLSGTVAQAVTKRCKTFDSVTGSGVCYGTKERDTLLGTGKPNEMHGKGAGDTLKGGGDVDGLHGEGGADRLSGGSGEDFLSPGPGNDASNGGANADLYSFGPGSWGRDRVEDPDTGNRIHLDDIGAALTISLTPSPLGPELASGKSTVNWSGSIVRDVINQNSGDSEIHGNDASNNIESFAGGGDDVIFGGPGDDTIIVADGDDGDFVDCGEGNDTVERDGRTDTSRGDTTVNCEN
jgi:Ca2+-binding RTX toxin-like protein